MATCLPGSQFLAVVKAFRHQRMFCSPPVNIGYPVPKTFLVFVDADFAESQNVVQ